MASTPSSKNTSDTPAAPAAAPPVNPAVAGARRRVRSRTVPALGAALIVGVAVLGLVAFGTGLWHGTQPGFVPSVLHALESDLTPSPAPGAAPAAQAAVAAAPAAPGDPASLDWNTLTDAQRQALEPLAQDWVNLDRDRRRKWIEIANRFPHLTKEEQEHRQARMRELVQLTPQQRTVARDSFAHAQKLDPERRAELYRRYQELPPERKAQLAAQGRAVAKTIVASPPHIAAVGTFPSKAQIKAGSMQKVPGVPAVALPPTIPVATSSNPSPAPVTDLSRPAGPPGATPSQGTPGLPGASGINPPRPASLAGSDADSP